MTSTLIDNTKNNLCIRSNATTRDQVNIGVLVSNINDPYINLVIQGLENIQKNNENKIKFTFFDSKLNKAIENEALDNLLRSDIDLLLGNLLETKIDALENFIDKIKEKEILAVLFNAEPLYKVGMNLISNKPPSEGTNYKFDETGTIIRIPYRGVIPQ